MRSILADFQAYECYYDPSPICLEVRNDKRVLRRWERIDSWTDRCFLFSARDCWCGRGSPPPVPLILSPCYIFTLFRQVLQPLLLLVSLFRLLRVFVLFFTCLPGLIFFIAVGPNLFSYRAYLFTSEPPSRSTIAPILLPLYLSLLLRFNDGFRFPSLNRVSEGLVMRDVHRARVFLCFFFFLLASENEKWGCR